MLYQLSYLCPEGQRAGLEPATTRLQIEVTLQLTPGKLVHFSSALLHRPLSCSKVKYSEGILFKPPRLLNSAAPGFDCYSP